MAEYGGYRDYVEIMEKKIETIIYKGLGFRATLLHLGVYVGPMAGAARQAA